MSFFQYSLFTDSTFPRFKMDIEESAAIAIPASESSVKTNDMVELFSSCGFLFGELAHVDLAGDGGGDQRGAAFLEQVDGALGFGDQCL